MLILQYYWLDFDIEADFGRIKLEYVAGNHGSWYKYVISTTSVVALIVYYCSNNENIISTYVEVLLGQTAIEII